MSVSDELRRYLDECGIEHADASYKRNTPITAWHSHDSAFCFVEAHDKNDLHIENATLEQAINATFGGEPCEMVHVKKGPMYDVWRCSVCGYEYAESVAEYSIVQNYCPNYGCSDCPLIEPDAKCEITDEYVRMLWKAEAKYHERKSGKRSKDISR